jgi:hypothetical protein
MAHLLGCAMQSVARWETVSEPQSITLWRLWELASGEHYDDLAAEFRAAMDKYRQKDRREAEDIQMDVNRWVAIRNILETLKKESEALSAAKHPAGPRIAQSVTDLTDLTAQARLWSWRNR